MAEHPNAALLAKGYDAFGKGDLDTVREIFAPDIKWHTRGNNPLAGDLKGVDEVFANFGKLFELTGGSFKLTIHHMLADDTHAVVLIHSSGERNGKKLDQNGVHVWHVNDGLATEFWGFDEDLYAGDEFFS